jgi:anthranilate synthase/aminodeoxychorismate synthase-like glutamine amidotransferase
MHGQASTIQHSGRGLFSGLPNPLTVGRYHSLVVERQTLPSELDVIAWTDDEEIMALAHRNWPVYGVQFHPESILTQGGNTLLNNFLKLAGIQSCETHTLIDDERPANAPSPILPVQPVTF